MKNVLMPLGLRDPLRPDPTSSAWEVCTMSVMAAGISGIVKQTTRRSAAADAARPASAGAFEHDAALALGELQHAVTAMLDAVSTEMRTVVDVEKAFGIDHKLGWQLYRIVRAKSPFAVGGSVPARVSMDRLLKAAARRRVPSERVTQVSDAFDRFERFVGDHAGDRHTLEAMLSAYLPEAREKQELAAKETAFKGMAQVVGMSIETNVNAFISHPSLETTGKPGWDDSLLLMGVLGFRRIRPDASLAFATADYTKSSHVVLTLDRATPQGPNAFLLPEYCSSPLPGFVSEDHDGESQTFVAGNDLGLKSSVDLVSAQYRPGVVQRHRSPNGKKYRGMVRLIGTPTRRLVADFFIHKDMHPEIAPQLKIYNTVGKEAAKAFDDPARERDLIRMQERIVTIPGGLPHARLTGVPWYVSMLEHACAKMAWNPLEFQGYRLEVQYPVYSAAYNFGFELPEPPQPGS